MGEQSTLLPKMVIPLLIAACIVSGAWIKTDRMVSSGSSEAVSSEPTGLWLKFSHCSGSAEFLEGFTVWLYGAGASLYETNIYLKGYSQEETVQISLEYNNGWTFTPPTPCFSDPGTNELLTEVSSYPLNLRGSIAVRRGDPETGELGTFDIEVIEYVPPSYYK